MQTRMCEYFSEILACLFLLGFVGVFIFACMNSFFIPFYTQPINVDIPALNYPTLPPIDIPTFRPDVPRG